MQVTGIVAPSGNTAPDSGEHVTSIAPSIASTALVEKVATLPVELCVSIIMSSMGVITGGTLSSTNLSLKSIIWSLNWLMRSVFA